MPRGGKRPGAGRKPGTKEKSTLERLAEEALIREMVKEALEPMTRAQIAAATGYRHLVARDRRGGKFKPITEAEAAKLNDPDVISEIWEKHPSPEAYRSLLDRAYGRPTMRLEAEVAHEAGPKLEILLSNRKRIGNGHAS